MSTDTSEHQYDNPAICPRRQPSDEDQAADRYQLACTQFTSHFSMLGQQLDEYERRHLLPLLVSVALSAIEAGRMGVVSGWDRGPTWLAQVERERNQADSDDEAEADAAAAAVARGVGA